MLTRPCFWAAHGSRLQGPVQAPPQPTAGVWDGGCIHSAFAQSLKSGRVHAATYLQELRSGRPGARPLTAVSWEPVKLGSASRKRIKKEFRLLISLLRFHFYFSGIVNGLCW